MLFFRVCVENLWSYSFKRLLLCFAFDPVLFRSFTVIFELIERTYTHTYTWAHAVNIYIEIHSHLV